MNTASLILYFLAANAPISHHLSADKGFEDKGFELVALDEQVTTQIIELRFSAILIPTVGDRSANL